MICHYQLKIAEKSFLQNPKSFCSNISVIYVEYSANILFLPSYLILEITKFILSSTGVKDLDNEVSSVPNVESRPLDEEKLREIVNESVDYYLGNLIIP